MRKINIWKRLVMNPAIVVLVMSLALVILNLYLTQYARPYSSDDVSWQNILNTWSPTNGHIVDMGAKDNFLVNVPLLDILGHIFNANRTLLFIEASFFAATNFVLVYIAGLYFLKKCKIRISYETLLPYLWLASFGFNFSQLFLNTSWRDYEIGVSFVYYVLATKIYYREIDALKSWTSRILTTVAIIVAGAFSYSDPYFLYLTLLPIVVLYLVLFVAKRVTKIQTLIIVGSVAASIVVSQALKMAVARVGLRIPQSTSSFIIPGRHVIHVTLATVRDMFTLFGVNTSGVKLFSFLGLASVLNLAILVSVSLWLLLRIVKHRKQHSYKLPQQLSPAVFLLSFLGALYVLVFVANMTDGEDSYRYFVLSAYLVTVLASFVSSTLKRRAGTAFAILIWAAICINLAISVFITTPMQNYVDSGNKTNAENYALIQEIESLGLTKGYGNYWNGNINTYLSNGTVSFLPVTCINNETRPFDLLIDTTLFAPSTSQSFYLYDPSKNSPVMCSQQEVLAQFGVPLEVIPFRNMSILVYNYDLASKMQ